ncbi:MAG: YIP1 family protein [Alphaproteobacteria bacterium]|nr:MAG: YIP1 family protein [Alphaproteobacteria bacterium]
MATNPDGAAAPSLVERARNIVLTPKTEWERIDAEPATVGSLYRNYIAILAAIPAIAMAVGMLLFGINLIIVTIRPPMATVLSQAVISYVMALVGVFVLALIIDALAPTFGGTKSRIQALKLAAYSYTPAWIAGVLLLLPALALLVALASLYSLYLLMLGLPVLMKAPKEKRGGYLAAVIVAAILLYVVIAAVTSAVNRTMAPTVAAPTYTLP